MFRLPLQLPLTLAVVVAVFKDRADLVAENIVLRHQLSCLKHRGKRPELRPLDCALWAILSRCWSRWRELLVMVKPATVVRWHRKGFRLFWCQGSGHLIHGSGLAEQGDPVFPNWSTVRVI